MLSFDVIKLLYEKPSKTFQEIVNELHCGRSNCNNALDQLKKDALVDSKPKNWRVGQKRFFSLTGKGRDFALKEIDADLNRNYNLLKNTLEETLTPTTINLTRQKAAFHPTEEEFEIGCIKKERIKEMCEQREKVLAPLNNLFFELTKVLLKADKRLGFSENLENVKIHFKEGKPFFRVDPDRSYFGK